MTRPAADDKEQPGQVLFSVNFETMSMPRGGCQRLTRSFPKWLSGTLQMREPPVAERPCVP
jgi:hypothetical protein